MLLIPGDLPLLRLICVNLAALRLQFDLRTVFQIGWTYSRMSG